MFPEEATVVRGEIYGYVRHPLYLSLMCGTIALAFLRNNEWPCWSRSCSWSRRWSRAAWRTGI